jgi:hypothetical protein
MATRATTGWVVGGVWRPEVSKSSVVLSCVYWYYYPFLPFVFIFLWHLSRGHTGIFWLGDRRLGVGVDGIARLSVLWIPHRHVRTFYHLHKVWMSLRNYARKQVKERCLATELDECDHTVQLI